MTDEEYRQQVNQRWKETMALLGFDDPGPAPETEQARPEPSQPPSALRMEPEKPQNVEPRRIVTATIELVEEEIANRRAERSKAAEESSPTTLGASEVTSELDSGDDKSNRRRRGRRGRRGSKSDMDATSGDQEGTAVESEPRARPMEDKEVGPKRGRGRTRERPTRTRESDRNEKVESAPTEAAFKGDFDDDEPIDLSDWVVPSW